MKKFLMAVAVAVTSLAASAGLPGDMFNHVGVGVGVGTTGISVEASTPITRWVQMRAGVAIMPGIKFHADADAEFAYRTNAGNVYRDSEVELTGDLGRTQGYVIFNVYPLPKIGLYVALGAYFGGNKLVKITGYSPELASYGGSVTIGDYVIPANTKGEVSGGIKVNGFRPYVGIGWGKAVPSRRINFGIDLGVQIHGKPSLYTDYGELDLSEVTDDDTFQKIMDKVRVYPTLTFKLGFRAY